MHALLVVVSILVGVVPLCGQELTGGRFASADLDSDGRTEVVLAGRFGPFSPTGGRGLLQVGEVRANHVRILFDAGDLPVVRDVAVGDLGLDGRLEVFTVGEGLLSAYAYQNGALSRVAEVRLETEWTDRVAVLTGTSDALIVVTEYGARPDRDAGATRLRAFGIGGGDFEERWTMSIDAHVGDLALVEGQPDLMVVETGTGDEGGDLLVYALDGSPNLRWRGRMTDGRRCLSVEAADRRRLVVHPVGGPPRILRVDSDGVRVVGTVPGSGRDALVPIVSRDGAVTGIGLMRGSPSLNYRVLID